jgi:Ca2+-binding EF-hand superfamily protein
MAWSLTTEEQQQVREAFVEIDSDHTGAITLNQFKKVLEERFHFNDAHSRAVFEALDVDHEDEIHYSEFLAAMASARVHFHDELLRETFKRFDADASGYITAHTLQQVLTDLPEGELKKLIGEADEDGDGRITFDEFARFMKEEGSQYHHVAGKILDDADHSASKSRKLQSKKVSKTPIPGDRKTKEDEKDWLLCCLAR